MNRYTDIHLQAIDDRLAVVRGVDGERLGDWILDDRRNGPWIWVPVDDAAPRELPPADNLVAAETAVRAWIRERQDIEDADRRRSAD